MYPPGSLVIALIALVKTAILRRFKRAFLRVFWASKRMITQKRTAERI